MTTESQCAQPEPEALPHPGSPEADKMLDTLLAEYGYPANMKNAARAGYMAARRLLGWARKPMPDVQAPEGAPAALDTVSRIIDDLLRSGRTPIEGAALSDCMARLRATLAVQPQAAPADNNSMGQPGCYPAGEKTTAAPAEGDALPDDAALGYCEEMLRWAYPKLLYRGFADMDDAIALDRMKNYLEHGVMS